MLWKIRIRLADRPGTLAELARECGESGVNILAMQVFPGIESVTDELVVRLPGSWGADEVCDLVARAGASFVGANLQGANFTRAQLSNADLTGANLDQAIFLNAQMDGCKGCP